VSVEKKLRFQKYLKAVLSTTHFIWKRVVTAHLVVVTAHLAVVTAHLTVVTAHHAVVTA
jgi:hypothetical protein